MTSALAYDSPGTSVSRNVQGTFSIFRIKVTCALSCDTLLPDRYRRFEEHTVFRIEVTSAIAPGTLSSDRWVPALRGTCCIHLEACRYRQYILAIRWYPHARMHGVITRIITMRGNFIDLNIATLRLLDGRKELSQITPCR